MTDLTEQAIRVAVTFLGGEKTTFVSHPPHAYEQKNQTALDELVENGLLIKASGEGDSVVYTGTTAIDEIARAHGPRVLDEIYSSLDSTPSQM